MGPVEKYNEILNFFRHQEYMGMTGGTAPGGHERKCSKGPSSLRNSWGILPLKPIFKTLDLQARSELLRTGAERRMRRENALGGSGGLPPEEILKYRVSEMLFPAFWDDILKNSEGYET